MSAGNVCAVLAKQDIIVDDDTAPTLEERIDLLARSIYYVKAAQQSRLLGRMQFTSMSDYVSGDGLSKLQHDKIVADEQRNLWNKLNTMQNPTPNDPESENEKGILLKRLSQNLIQVSDLYNIAKEQKCWDRCLSIIQCIKSDTPKIQNEIQYSWVNIFVIAFHDVMNQITQTTADGVNNPERNPFMEHMLVKDYLSHHVVETGASLWIQNDVHIAINVQFLFAMIELANYYTLAVSPSADRPEFETQDLYSRVWSCDLLLRMNIPMSDLLEVYKHFLMNVNGPEIEEAKSRYERWVPALKEHVLSQAGARYTTDEHVQLSFAKFINNIVNMCDKESVVSIMQKNSDVSDEFLHDLLGAMDTYLRDEKYEDFRRIRREKLTQFMKHLRQYTASSPVKSW
tara:strand:+ start:66 stop:1262 length:1197 start_codon:yes stop_codon:yes gene_type:complete